MKKSNKLLILICSLAATMSLAACNLVGNTTSTSDGDVPVSSESVSTPDNSVEEIVVEKPTLSVENAVISWTVAEGTSYEYKLNEGEWTTVEGASIDCTAFTETTTVSVRGKIGEEVSEAATQVITVAKLAAPTITVADGIVSWATENGNAYQYQVNGGEWVDGASIQLPTAIGAYSLKVKAVAYVEGANVYLASDESEAQEYTVAPQKATLSVNNGKVEIAAENGVAYEYSINGVDYVAVPETGIDFSGYTETTTISVIGKANGVTGEAATQVITVAKLAAPTITVADGIVSWTTENGNAYQYQVNGGEWVDGASIQLPTAIGAYRLKVKAVAYVEGANVYLASDESEAQEYTVAPQKATLSVNNGKVEIAAENGVAYEYSINGVDYVAVPETGIDFSGYTETTTITVIGKANGVTGEAATQVITVAKLAVPTITVADGIVSWATENGKTYQYQVNGGEWVDGASVQIPDVPGTYTLKVKAIGYVEGANVYLASDESEAQSQTVATRFEAGKDENADAVLNISTNDTFDKIELYINNRKAADNIVADVVDGAYDLATAGYLTGADFYAKVKVVAVKGEETFESTELVFEKLSEGVQVGYNPNGSEPGKKNDPAYKAIQIPVDSTKFDSDSSTIEWVNVTLDIKGTVGVNESGAAATGGMYIRAYDWGVANGTIKKDPSVIKGADNWFAAYTATEWKTIQIRIPKQINSSDIFLVPFAYPSGYPITVYVKNITVDHDTISTSSASPVQYMENVGTGEVVGSAPAGTKAISVNFDKTKFAADGTLQWFNVTMKVRGTIGQGADGSTCTGGIYMRAYEWGGFDKASKIKEDPVILSGVSSWVEACSSMEWKEITVRIPQRYASTGYVVLHLFGYPTAYPISMEVKDIEVDYDTITESSANPIQKAVNAFGSERGNKADITGCSAIAVSIDLTKFDSSDSTIEWVNVTMKARGSIAQDANGNTCTGGIYMRAYEWGLANGANRSADPYIVSGAASWFEVCTSTEWKEITVRLPKQYGTGAIYLNPFCYPGTYPITMEAKGIVVDYTSISTTK